MFSEATRPFRRRQRAVSPEGTVHMDCAAVVGLAVNPAWVTPTTVTGVFLVLW